MHSTAEIGLLDCTRVGFFNPSEPFQSAHPFGGGDTGSDLAIRPDVLTEVLARHDPEAAQRPGRPFTIGSGPCPPEAFLLLRTLHTRIELAGSSDGLEVEELSLILTEQIIQAAFDTPKSGHSPTAREREETESLRGILTSQPGRRHQLDALARRLGSTPFRLCRSFRAVTGTTIHRYLTRVRVQQALGRLADGSPDLTDLAFDLGFSSHSHFTSVFRKCFGMTPEAVRRQARSRTAAELGGRLGLQRANKIRRFFESSVTQKSWSTPNPTFAIEASARDRTSANSTSATSSLN